MKPTSCPSFCITPAWHPVHSLHKDLVWMLITVRHAAIKLPLVDLWTKICKQSPLTLLFLCSTGVEHLDVPELKLASRQISPWATMCEQTWLLVCHSLLRAVYGLTDKVWIPRGKRRLWYREVMREKWSKDREIKRIEEHSVSATWNLQSFCVMIQKIEQRGRVNRRLMGPYEGEKNNIKLKDQSLLWIKVKTQKCHYFVIFW